MKEKLLYKIPLIFEPQPEGGYTVTCPILPELVTEGDTVAEAVENVGDALIAIIEAYEALGRYLKDLKMGTLRHIVQQLGLEWETFKQA